MQVRAPRLDELAAALRRTGLDVRDDDGALSGTGTTTEHVGEIAAANGLVLHELALRRGSLEEAFMESTKKDVQYAAGVAA